MLLRNLREVTVFSHQITKKRNSRASEWRQWSPPIPSTRPAPPGSSRGGDCETTGRVAPGDSLCLQMEPDTGMRPMTYHTLVGIPP